MDKISKNSIPSKQPRKERDTKSHWERNSVRSNYTFATSKPESWVHNEQALENTWEEHHHRFVTGRIILTETLSSNSMNASWMKYEGICSNANRPRESQRDCQES